jgi:hypothetical protein
VGWGCACLALRDSGPAQGSMTLLRHLVLVRRLQRVLKPSRIASLGCKAYLLTRLRALPAVPAPPPGASGLPTYALLPAPTAPPLPPSALAAADATPAPAVPSMPPAADAATGSAPPPQPQVTRKRLAGAYGQCGAAFGFLHEDPSACVSTAVSCWLSSIVITCMLSDCFTNGFSIPSSTIAHPCVSCSGHKDVPICCRCFQLTVGNAMQAGCGATVRKRPMQRGATRCAPWGPPVHDRAPTFGAANFSFSALYPLQLANCHTCQSRAAAAFAMSHTEDSFL